MANRTISDVNTKEDEAGRGTRQTSSLIESLSKILYKFLNFVFFKKYPASANYSRYPYCCDGVRYDTET